MFWLDAALRVGWVNRAWEELTGQPAESVIGPALRVVRPERGGEPADLAASLVPPPEVVAGRPAGTRALFLNAERRTTLAADRILALSRPGGRPARRSSARCASRAILPACPIRRPTSSASASWSCGTECIGRSDSSP